MATSVDQLTVVEIAGSAAGGYAGRLFAGWGAHVMLADVGSDSTVRHRPHRKGAARYLDHAKHQRSFADPDDPALRALLDVADVVIESSSPRPMQAVSEPRPGLIRLEISPLGRGGPLDDRWSTEFTDQAAGGHLLLNGDPDREPVAGPVDQVLYAAGLHGYIGVVAAIAGGRLPPGETVEINHLQVMASLHQFTLIRRLNGGDLLRRMGNRWAGPGRPCGLYECLDGHISIIVPRDDQLERLLAVADLLDLLATPGIEHAYDLMHHPTLLDDHLRPWFAARQVAETVELLQAVRVPAAPVSDMDDLLHDPHLAERGSLVAADGVRVPGAPAHIANVPWRTSPAPPSRPESEPVDEVQHNAPPERPLAGLRVVDLARVWAGPLATRILADLGADVVMVEAPWARGGPTIDQTSVQATAYYPDNEPGEQHWNRIGFVNKYALGKRSVALDLSGVEGREALEALISTADVVIENFSPRVMPQLGFDETRLRELNPDIVYVTMPGYGRTGPDRDRVAYGPIVDAHGGLASLMGYPGEPARAAGVAWPDPIAGLHAAAATLTALLAHRADPAEGGVVEVAQIEATIAMVGAALAQYQLDGTLFAPAGNAHDELVPQVALRCAGDDRWVALSVIDDDGWQHVARRIGAPEFAGLDREGRHSRADEIEETLAAWASGREQHDVVAAMAAPGVAVAAVADAQQVIDDLQLRALDAWTMSDHPAAGREIWPRTAIRLGGHVLDPERPAPTLGEHNDLLRDETDLGPDRYRSLVTEGIVADQPPG